MRGLPQQMEKPREILQPKDVNTSDFKHTQPASRCLIQNSIIIMRNRDWCERNRICVHHDSCLLSVVSRHIVFHRNGIMFFNNEANNLFICSISGGIKWTNSIPLRFSEYVYYSFFSLSLFLSCCFPYLCSFFRWQQDSRLEFTQFINTFRRNGRQLSISVLRLIHDGHILDSWRNNGRVRWRRQK